MSTQLGKDFAFEGYVVVESLFSREEVASFKEASRQIIDDVRREAKEKGVYDYTQHGIYVGLAAQSELFRKVAADERLVKVLTEVMGDNILFLSDKVAFKNAEADFESPWHQDWPYWKGHSKISVWIALDDATPENGCLKIIPGSHLYGAVAHANVDEKAFGNRLKDIDIDEEKALSVPISAGSAIVFHDMTYHASHANSSGSDRWALISTYMDAHARESIDEWVASFLVCGTRQA